MLIRSGIFGVKKLEPKKEKEKTPPPVIVTDNNTLLEEKTNIEQSVAENKYEQQNIEENLNTSTKTQSKTKTKSQDSQVEGIAPTITFDVDIQHVEIKESTTYDAEGKTLTVYGGGGVSYANIYPKGYNSVDKTALIAQTKAEMIDYSDKKFGRYDKVVI